MRSVFSFVLVAFLTITLSGCAPMLVGYVAPVAAMVGVDAGINAANNSIKEVVIKTPVGMERESLEEIRSFSVSVDRPFERLESYLIEEMGKEGFVAQKIGGQALIEGTIKETNDRTLGGFDITVDKGTAKERVIRRISVNYPMRCTMAQFAEGIAKALKAEITKNNAPPPQVGEE